MVPVLIVVIGVLIITVIVLYLQIQTQAKRKYEEWRDLDLKTIRAENEKTLHTLKAQETSLAHREAQNKLEQWKMSSETAIRQDAITRSHAVNLGKISEHLMPYMSIFPYNSKDARFIGSPIDLLVFHGADDGNVEEIIFLEVKSGSSSLSPRQKQIKAAILEGKVSWRELRV